MIKNINSENLVVTRIIIDGVGHNYSEQIVAGDQKSIKLKSIIPCSSDKKNYSVKIKYISSSGLTKVADFQSVSIDCAPVVTPVGVAVDEIPLVVATGGTVTLDGDYKIHTFKESGTFSVSSGGNVELLIVAGGGGGAGGLVYKAAHSLSAGSYSVTVGNGGLGRECYYDGLSGGNSVFDGITALGGGGGGGQMGGSNGLNGGSGGGGSVNHVGGTKTQGDSGGGIGYGNNGGNGSDAYSGGGGGGAGAVGENAPDASAGDGGIGREYFGTYYAGGGGGTNGDAGFGVGGLGGGGNGSTTGDGVAGTPNTGGGGGAGAVGGYGGNGGSGIVIIRYLTDS